MDVSSMASAGTLLSQIQFREQAQIGVLKSALEMAATGPLQLLESVTATAPASSSTNPNLGSRVDIRV